MTARVKSGVIGLDEKMQGGFVEGSVNLIIGKAGTGKTAFCSSFLYEGAKKGEPGLYITTEEAREDIKNDVKAMFGWDFKALEDKGTLKFLSIKPILPTKGIIESMDKLVKLYVSELTATVGKSVTSINAKRVVIDSISIVEMIIQNRYIARVALMSILEQLKKLGVTIMITEGIPRRIIAVGEEAMIEFIVDAVIEVDFVAVAEKLKRTLTIQKMRRTDHSTFIHPFAITKNGLKLARV